MELRSNNIYLHACKNCIYFNKTPEHWYKQPKHRCDIHTHLKLNCKDKITEEEVQHARRTL